jgi:DNA-3-methyladenine glycosylase II
MKNNAALNHLRQDAILATIIAKYELETNTQEVDVYLDILDAIVSQQLSVKAAATIFKRFKELFSQPIPPVNEILAMPEEKMRSAGLSFQKIKYVKAFAQALYDKTLDLESLKNLSDEDVITELTKVKGIGRWTAEMILIFSLKREDIFSLGDLGLRNAVARLYDISRDDLKQIEDISKKWAPHRSLASRYLWKSLENTPKLI